MVADKDNILSYQPKTLRRRHIIVWMLAILCVPATFVAFRIFGAHKWRSDNDPWNYGGRVGADLALEKICQAATAYADANNGALPSDVSQVRPHLRKPSERERKYPVTPERLLPHVTIIPAAEGPTTLPSGGHPRFFVVVHVLGAGPMTFNWTLVAADTGYDDAYKDPEFITAFGNRRLQQLKQSAYQLP